jgi:hypothetical protein
MMAAQIISAFAAHEARVVVEGDRVRVLFPPDRPPPQELIAAAREHKETLRAMLAPSAGHPYGTAFAALRSKCPELVESDRWQQAVRDADCFLLKWGAQAHAPGWTKRELFGLHPIPERPTPTFRRLSRYDSTGLIWLLRGRPVIALTETEAAIQSPGAVVMYRKHRKPAYGLLGECLDDMEPDEGASDE